MDADMIRRNGAARFCYSAGMKWTASVWTRALAYGALTAMLVVLAACSGSKSGDRRDEQRTGESGESGEPGQPGEQPTGAGSDEKIDAKDLVALELLASVERVAPGAAFELGAHFRMAPGWHIYWTNPGDAGLETRARFSAPEGVTLGEVLYPGPIRFDSPGDVTSYGYKDSTALLVRAQAPAELSADAPLEFGVDTRWVACRDVCIAGTASASLSVAVAKDAESPVDAASTAILDPHRERLPRPFAELEGATLTWTEGGEGRALLVRVPGAQAIEFFPALEQPALIADQRARASGDQAEMEIHYRGTANPAIPAGGVVRVERSGASRYYEIAVPWS
jgi:DsbC/DsbD-like thiol-disulfide interchange protein